MKNDANADVPRRAEKRYVLDADDYDIKPEALREIVRYL